MNAAAPTMDTQAIKADYQAIALQRDAARLAEGNSLAELATALERQDVAQEAVDLLTAAADSQREQVRKNVEAVVTAALRAVFGPELSLEIDVGIKRGVVSMEPFVVYAAPTVNHPGRRVPVTEIGGGVADVIAFAFRVAVLCLRRPKLRPVILADEPFKHVSARFLPRVATMLRELVDRTGLQLVIVSHEPEIAETADRLLRVTMTDNGSVITQES